MNGTGNPVAGYALLDQVQNMATAVVLDYPYDFRAAYPNVGWGRKPDETQLLRISTVLVVDIPSEDDSRDHTITPILPPVWNTRGQWEQTYSVIPDPSGLEQAKVDGKLSLYSLQRSKVYVVTQGDGRFEANTESVKRDELVENGGVSDPDMSFFPVMQGEQIGRGWTVAEAIVNISVRVDEIYVKLGLYDKEKFIAEDAIDVVTSAGDIDAILATYKALV